MADGVRGPSESHGTADRHGAGWRLGRDGCALSATLLFLKGRWTPFLRPPGKLENGTFRDPQLWTAALLRSSRYPYPSL